MPNILSNLLTGSAGDIIGAVGDVIDKASTSTEEKLMLDNEIRKAEFQYSKDMKMLDVQAFEAGVKDNDSARQHQSRVQESQHASFLAKNIQPILAFTIIGLTFLLYGLIILGSGSLLAKDSGVKEILIYILGALSAITIQVVQYFFGSSQGSSDKGRVAAELQTAMMESIKKR